MNEFQEKNKILDLQEIQKLEYWAKNFKKCLTC